MLTLASDFTFMDIIVLAAWLIVASMLGIGVVAAFRHKLTRRRHADSPIEKEFETKWRFGIRTAELIVRLTSRFRSEISLPEMPHQ